MTTASVSLRSRSRSWAGAGRLLRLEFRRNTMIWVLPLLAAAFWFDAYHWAAADPPRRQVSRQVPPGASGPVHVQDRLHDPAQRPDPWPAPPSGHVTGQMRGDHLPLGIGQVTGIAPGLLFSLARTLGTREPCLLGLHASRSWARARSSQR
jgi:hypothetical protein